MGKPGAGSSLFILSRAGALDINRAIARKKQRTHQNGERQEKNMGRLTSRQFWKATAVRCLRTFLVTIAAFLPAGTLLTEVNWGTALLVSASATAGIFLACIVAGLPEVDPANDPDAYDDDVEPITMEELQELDEDLDESEDE